MTPLRSRRDRSPGGAGADELQRSVRRLRLGVVAVASVVVLGTLGYVLLGFSLLDALYQTVTTVTTVGFREVQEFSPTEQVYTIVLILAGVGTVLYTLSMFIETMIEGHVGSLLERRRMQREIDSMQGHAIVCGWGRVGSVVAHQLAAAGQEVVVVDSDEARLAGVPFPTVHGDATQDEVLRRCGVDRASMLFATLATDAASLYLVLSARSLNPGLRIVARGRTPDADTKFLRAGADKVINPQRIGGARIAAAALQPHVVDFLDVVMHDRGVEFRMAEVQIVEGSPLAGRTVGDWRGQDEAGALLLAMRRGGGAFLTNPPRDTRLATGDILIAVGTDEQLAGLRREAGRAGTT